MVQDTRILVQMLPPTEVHFPMNSRGGGVNSKKGTKLAKRSAGWFCLPNIFGSQPVVYLKVFDKFI